MNQRYFFPFLFPFLLSFGFLEISNEIIQFKNPHHLELTITTNSNTLSVSNYILPEINTSIFNHSENQICIVIPGDGSLSAWRTPIVRWSVIKTGDEFKKHPKKVLPEIPKDKMGCKLINRIQIDEIITLDPNAEFQINNLIHFLSIPKEIGTYSVRLYYQNKPNHKWIMKGYHGQEVKKIISNETEEFLLISNELIFNVIK